MILIYYILRLFVYLLIIDIILSYFPQLMSQKWAQTLHKIADVPQRPIREMLPKDLPLDPTPMILILLINMLIYIIF